MNPGAKKVLIGCSIALGVFILAVIIAIGMGVVWITQKMDILEPHVFISQELTGFFQVLVFIVSL